jgi:hypothetical protein
MSERARKTMPSESKSPGYRRLHGYAIDPTLSLIIDTVDINETVYEIDWEPDLKPGPRGEYIEVIDFDPTTKKYYQPVNLNDPYILANGGISPSESNPLFHQQFVYAVAMLTVRNFEKALGRQIFWAPRQVDASGEIAPGVQPVEPEHEDRSVANWTGNEVQDYEQSSPSSDYEQGTRQEQVQQASPITNDASADPSLDVRQVGSGSAGGQDSNSAQSSQFVGTLRLYPHALREANAYYSPHKKAILFGYFSASPANRTLIMPGSLVFTCLSHDIIVHEMTHAILDGLNRYYSIPTNPDVLAFHEAFADIVALFQHFTFPNLLKQQIARTRGNLENQNLLGQLAQQFGTAIGQYGSLRDALGTTAADGKWIPAVPNPGDYLTEMKPHKRGSILVAAVFEAFLSIYKRRVADLLRIASGGTGILPEGELHPDMVNRLADEAAKAASHILTMCIRAIDYCPPVDITFGDFLRALITADSELVVKDTHHYRLAFIDAFRRRGIYPEGIKTLSEESLQYRVDTIKETRLIRDCLDILANYLKNYRNAVIYKTDREEIFNITEKFISDKLGLRWRVAVKGAASPEGFESLTGIVFDPKPPKGFMIEGLMTKDGKNVRFENHDNPDFEAINLRLVSNRRQDGRKVDQIIFSLVQKIGVVFEGRFIKNFYLPEDDEQPKAGHSTLLVGCTLIFDLNTTRLKYAITKPFLLPRDEGEPPCINEKLLERQYQYQTGMLSMHLSEEQRYFYTGFQSHLSEPFALLHHH